MSGGLVECELQRLRAVGRQRHLETLEPQRAANRVTQGAVIINEQDLADGHTPRLSTSGVRTRKKPAGRENAGGARARPTRLLAHFLSTSNHPLTRAGHLSHMDIPHGSQRRVTRGVFARWRSPALQSPRRRRWRRQANKSAATGPDTSPPAARPRQVQQRLGQLGPAHGDVQRRTRSVLSGVGRSWSNWA